MTATFAGMPLSNPAPSKYPSGIVSNTQMTFAGTSVQLTSNRIFKTTLSCFIDGLRTGLVRGQVPGEITILLGLVGSFNTLSLDGVEYTNCAITSLEYDEVEGTGGMAWEYTVEFTQHTAGE